MKNEIETLKELTLEQQELLRLLGGTESLAENFGSTVTILTQDRGLTINWLRHSLRLTINKRDLYDVVYVKRGGRGSLDPCVLAARTGDIGAEELLSTVTRDLLGWKTGYSRVGGVS